MTWYLGGDAGTRSAAVGAVDDAGQVLFWTLTIPDVDPPRRLAVLRAKLRSVLAGFGPDGVHSDVGGAVVEFPNVAITGSNPLTLAAWGVMTEAFATEVGCPVLEELTPTAWRARCPGLPGGGGAKKDDVIDHLSWLYNAGEALQEDAAMALGCALVARELARIEQRHRRPR